MATLADLERAWTKADLNQLTKRRAKSIKRKLKHCTCCRRWCPDRYFFTKNNGDKYIYCTLCTKERVVKFEQHSPITKLWRSARSRAADKQLPFDITEDDIIIPDVCPMLGIPLEVAKGGVKGHSPSLDRIVPELGYIKGNIWVISHRANMIKSNATTEELFKIANSLQEKTDANDQDKA